jgi:hypothetical protein
MIPRRAKYGNRKTVVDGITFDSLKEAKRWDYLTLLQRAGELSELRRQVRIPCIVNGALICTYIADFVYRDKDGVEITEDAKGFKTDIYRLKKKLVAACRSIEIVEV